MQKMVPLFRDFFSTSLGRLQVKLGSDARMSMLAQPKAPITHTRDCSHNCSSQPYSSIAE